MPKLAELLGIDEELLVATITDHAPWKNVSEMDTLEDYAQEFGEDATIDVLADALGFQRKPAKN